MLVFCFSKAFTYVYTSTFLRSLFQSSDYFKLSNQPYCHHESVPQTSLPYYIDTLPNMLSKVQKFFLVLGKAVNLTSSSNDGLGWLGFTVSIHHDEPEVLWPFVPPCFTSHASVHSGLRSPPQSFHNLPPTKRSSECGPITKRTSSPPGPVTFPQHICYKKQPNYCNWLRFILRKS